MFGYVTINQEELKIKEFRRYRSFYCGLCYSLKRRYGLKGQSILPYDMVFLDILLNGLYEEPLTEEDRFCVTHPTKKQHMIYNRITDYTADMGMILLWYKLLDDIQDENSRKAKALSKTIRKSAEQAMKDWPRQAKAAEQYVRDLGIYEKENASDLDAVAGVSGKVLGEIFVMEEGLWSDVLRETGFYLGKFIYLMDAYEDLDEDLKKGRYNPWQSYRDRRDFDALVENTLTMMMAECAKAFEKLPIVQDIDILRNIIYSGVWTKYRALQKKRNEEQSGKEDRDKKTPKKLKRKGS